MNRFRQGRRWLVLTSAAALFVSSACAQDSTNMSRLAVPEPPAPSMTPPPIPVTVSPVEYFRKLLAMSPQQLKSTLAKKSPKIQERILAKVNEYASMDPDERELRLRATELRWYLVPLLQAPPDQRSAQLAQVPADLRDLVQSRLTEWEILPPPVQQEFLDNEHIAGYFAGLSTTNLSSEGPEPNNAEQSHWNAYSEAERQAMIAQFIDFFDLSAGEKQKALGELTDTEREQMDKTLQAFEKLTGLQRATCFRAFKKFNNMSRGERAEFLKNAQRWSKMTPSERQAWRDLVAHVPQWPPIPTAVIVPPVPPAIMPPISHPAPQDIRIVAATNHG